MSGLMSITGAEEGPPMKVGVAITDVIAGLQASSAIKVLAKKIMPEGISPQEKVLRIHRYVQEEIRYEQDYENSIAGVKPHPAPVVFARRYGDCKDKAVLFITLAQLGGVKAHFAILKTTGKGTVFKEIPMQQFNHAIVYVPAQPVSRVVANTVVITTFFIIILLMCFTYKIGGCLSQWSESYLLSTKVVYIYSHNE